MRCDIAAESFTALRLKAHTPNLRKLEVSRNADRTPNLRKLDMSYNTDLFVSAKAAATTGAALPGSHEELEAASCSVLDSAMLKLA